jgi:hypothetical protein
MSAYRFAIASAVAVTVAFAAPAAAPASTLHVEPNGSTTSTACDPSDPCDLIHAVETVAQDGDEVVVKTGIYEISQTLNVTDAIELHGAPGQPRPEIRMGDGTWAYALWVEGVQADVSRLQIGSGAFIAALFVGGSGADGSTVDQVLAFSVPTPSFVDGCRFRDADVTLTNTACRTGADAGNAVHVLGVDSEVSTVDLVNVTAVAPAGADRYAVTARAVTGGTAVVNMTNTIAQGGSDVLTADDGTANANATVTASHSNYSAIQADSGPVTDPATNDNQTEEPDISGNMLHQQPGSPTVDAGDSTAAVGPVDIDEEVRVADGDCDGASVVDIGADELVADCPEPTPPGGGEGSGDTPQPSPQPSSSDTDPPETTITSSPGKSAADRRVRFEFEADEPGATFECRVDRHRFRECTSPFRDELKQGRHTFRVRARDAAGNLERKPARYRFTIE